MEWISTFRNSETAKRLAAQLQELEPPPARLMEVCGTHTMAIAHNGIRELMPPGLTLTSGPGCPVCVTATREIDLFLAAARLPDTIITTFGDLMRVPGSTSSLNREKGEGADVQLVYSALDALEIARSNPDKEVIFLGVGFETTAPTVAGAVLQAEAAGLENFSVISAHKLMPPALEALAADPELAIHGLLCPGHVSIMLGTAPYIPLAEKYTIPCVIAGFEPVDILHGLVLLARQLKEGVSRVEISYQRAVYEKGNAQAMAIMYRVFEAGDAHWRGLGEIPGSGLHFTGEYERFDAIRRFDLAVQPVADPKGCQCGLVLKGMITPRECKIFGKGCRPESPIGPCMVSSEGACAAAYRYGR